MKAGLLKFLFGFLVILGITQCNKDDDSPAPIDPSCANLINDTTQAKSSIIGDWNWIQTYTIVKGSVTPEVTTPETSGNKVLKFSPDNILQVIEENNHVELYNYTIKRSAIDPSLYIYFVKTVDNSVDASLLRLCSDTLIIDNSYDDSGGKELYVRVK